MNEFDQMVQGYKSQNIDDRFNAVFNQVGQYTSGLSAPNTGMMVAQRQVNQAKPSSFQQFFQKALAVGSQTANIAKQVGGAALGFVKNSVLDIGKSAYGSASTLKDLTVQPLQLETYNRVSKQLRDTQSRVISEYRSGKMSKQDYDKALKDISKGLEQANAGLKTISDGPTAKQRAQDIAETAINVLSLGSLGLAEIGGKQAIEFAGKQGIKALDKEAINALLDQGATNVERLLLKSGAARELITRNLVKMAEKESSQLVGESAFQFVRRNGTKLAADLLIKRPVFYQSNIGQAQSLYKNVLQGDYKGALTDAAWLGMQMIGGGPLGKAKDIAGYTKSAVGKLARGRGSFIDEVSARIGSKSRAQIAEFIAQSDDPKVEKVFRVLQDANLSVTKNKVDNAVDNFMSTYAHLTDDELAALTPKQIFEDALNWRDADEALQGARRQLIAKGMKPEDVDKLVVVRVDQRMRNAIANRVAGANSPEEAWKAVQELSDMPSVGFGNNNNFMLKLEKVIKEAPDMKTAAKQIQGIDAAGTISASIPAKLAKQIAEKGYTVAEPAGGRLNKFIDYEDTTKLISGAVKNPELFDPSAAPQPVVSGIANFMEKLGLSPEDSNLAATHKLSESVAASLDRTVAGRELDITSKNGAGDITNGGAAILSKLQNYIETKPGVGGFNRISAGQSSLMDIRQMTLAEIQSALGGKSKLSLDAAKEVRSAILKGYRDVPLELRGLGDKVVDTLYQINPAQKYYSRIQSALRYTYNPFFRVQESAETKILSHLQASNLIWMKSRTELDNAAKLLDDAGVFKNTLPGEAAGDVVLGRITANMTKGQKRDMAGLALDIANSQGKSLEQLAIDSPEMLTDALRVVVQYPNKGVISSPLARTMNLVFFPMRYNAKVTGLAANVLSKQPPAIQKAVLHSLFSFKDWLKSDEGIAWQSKNADAIQLFNWITPINSIQGTFNLLRKPESAADLGILGGLPLGVISQVLDGQGIISLNKPYVNPKTGDVFPRYIPESAKARAATALTDVLNTMFTYPGRVLGLPGKNEQLKKFVKNFIATNSSDFEKRVETDRLSPLQQNMIRVLKGDTSQEAVDALYQSPAAGQYNGYTLPPYTLPFNPSFDASSKYKAPKSKKRGKTLALPPRPL